MYTSMSLLRNREFHELNNDEKQQVLEARAMMFGAVTGAPTSVCRHCGAMFVSTRNAERHMNTSKKCIALRGEARQK
jgi:hypothetical protein